MWYISVFHFATDIVPYLHADLKLYIQDTMLVGSVYNHISNIVPRLKSNFTENNRLAQSTGWFTIRFLDPIIFQ